MSSGEILEVGDGIALCLRDVLDVDPIIRDGWDIGWFLFEW
jgi:hypothetical protein